MNVVKTIIDWFRGESDRNAEAETAGASGAAYNATIRTTPNPVKYRKRRRTIWDPDL